MVILDERVIDLSGFLEYHPGGMAVLIANLGRDVSADFHHVTAHTRHAVTRKLSRHVVAEVDRAVISPAWIAFPRLLDYMRIVLNSFEAQCDPERDPVTDLVYVGQLYCHFVGDHLCSFMNTLSEMTSLPVDPRALWRLQQISEATPKQVAQVLACADKSTAAALSTRMQRNCTMLLKDLLGAGVGAIAASRAGDDHNSFIACTDETLLAISRWISEEYDLVCIVTR